MTFEEAKKILEKEGFHMDLAKEVVNQAGAMREFEKPEVCKAIKVANANKLIVGLSPAEWYEREARLKKEFEERSNAPVPGKEQPEEKKRIICLSASPKADFYYKYVLNEGNPALKESASQFNDALLDEQAKEIDKQNKEITRLLSLVEKKENSISRLYYEKSVLEKENEELEKGEIPARYFDKALVDEQSGKINEKYNLKQIKRLGKEIAKLNGIIHDKNAVLADVAEELRLSKIREKNLTEVGQKYMKENEELKNELDAFKESYKRRLKEDSEHFGHIQKICNVGLQKWLLESEYLEKDKPFRFPQLPDFNGEEEKKHSLFRDDSVGAVTNRKDCSPVKDTHPTVDIAEEGGDHSAIIARCCKNIAISKDEAEIIERCTKNGTELHYSEKDGFTYTNVFGEEMPIICLRGMCQVFTDEEIKNMKK